MFTFAVCDDQREDAENLRCCISLFAQTQEIPVQTDVFSDGAALLNASQHYDLIFLDVEMSPMSGIETAKELRKREAFLKVPIVYVTSYPDYWRHAYQVHAFDFIESPFRRHGFSRRFGIFSGSFRRRMPGRFRFRWRRERSSSVWTRSVIFSAPKSGVSLSTPHPHSTWLRTP